MIKTADFIEQYKQGKVSAATLVKMAAFKDELERGIQAGKLDGLVKKALFPSEMKPGVTYITDKGPSFLSALGRGISTIKDNKPLMQNIGLAVLGAGLVTFTEILRGLEGKIIDWNSDRKKPQMMEEMLEVHPDMRDLPIDRVKLYFEALCHFSPSMAENPLTAGAYIKQAMKYDHVAQGPLPASIQEIGQIEKNRQQAAKDMGGSYFVKSLLQPVGSQFSIKGEN
jgi:hypothetical protein